MRTDIPRRHDLSVRPEEDQRFVEQGHRERFVGDIRTERDGVPVLTEDGPVVRGKGTVARQLWGTLKRQRRCICGCHARLHILGSFRSPMNGDCVETTTAAGPSRSTPRPDIDFMSNMQWLDHAGNTAFASSRNNNPELKNFFIPPV
jgi:hypothetical protein